MGLPAYKIEPVTPRSSSDKPNLRLVEGTLSGAATLANHTRGIYGAAFNEWRTGEKANYKGLTGDIAADMAAIAESYMELSIDVGGDFPQLEEGKRGIVIGNHPSNMQIWPWGHFVAQNFCRDMKLIAKKEFMYDPRMLPPFMGWPGKLAKILVMIDRKDRESAIASIRKACEETFTPDDAMVIFPGKHRTTEERIEKACTKMEEQYPDIRKWMKHTLFPYSGGLMNILDATKEHPVQILNTTVGSSGEKHPNGFGSTLHLRGEKVSRATLLGPSLDPKEQEAHLREWLVQEWKRKNRMITAWQKAA